MRLRLLSWNIRKAVGLDWRRDPARVWRVIEGLSPDVVFLQEADKRLGQRPAALPPSLVRAAGYAPIDADPDTPSIGWHGNALLVRRPFDLLEMHRVALPGLEPRGALRARVRLHGREVALVSAHLGLRRRDRKPQMTAIADAVSGEGCPVLVAGDLNEFSRDPRHLPVPAGWTVTAPGASFHADMPRLALDRFVTGPGVRLHDARVIPPRQARRASDHLPIAATAELG